MSYGSLSTAQIRALRPFVRGREVRDIGAGDLSLSLQLLKLGASHVYAIDKEPAPSWVSNKNLKAITYIQSEFGKLTNKPFPVGFCSWPLNCPNVGLTLLVSMCEEVFVYLGKNSDECCCGAPNLFTMTTCRELLAYVPDRKNTLIITGKFLDKPRAPTPEEKAGLLMYNTEKGPFSYDEIESTEFMQRIG